MKEKLQQRLQLLKTEFEAGQKMLAELEEKQAGLRQTLLRISGAVQVLEEVLEEMSEDDVIVAEVPYSDLEVFASGEETIAPSSSSRPLSLQ